MYKLHIHVYTEKSTAVSALLPDPKTILQFIGEETAVNWGFFFYNILDNKQLNIYQLLLLCILIYCTYGIG